RQPRRVLPRLRGRGRNRPPRGSGAAARLRDGQGRLRGAVRGTPPPRPAADPAGGHPHARGRRPLTHGQPAPPPAPHLPRPPARPPLPDPPSRPALPRATATVSVPGSPTRHLLRLTPRRRGRGPVDRPPDSAGLQAAVDRPSAAPRAPAVTRHPAHPQRPRPP